MSADKLLNILVVEDDASTSDLLRTSLVLLDGIDEVVTTDVGEEGLRLADELKPDIVIVDSSLSVGGGSVGARLREAIPKAIIISFSATEVEAPWADVAILKDEGGIDGVGRAVTASIAEPARENTDMRQFIHDMRNPVGALIGFVHLIKMENGRLNEEQMGSIIEGIERSANRLSELLEEFADQQKP